MTRLARLWRSNRLTLAAFVLTAALALFFTVRSVMFALYWNDPSHADQPISGWMTPRYVSYSWKIPPEVLGAALDLGPGQGRGQTLDEIAADRGMTLEDLIALIEATAEQHRAPQDPEAPPPPPGDGT